jgi:hypothetical protein
MLLGLLAQALLLLALRPVSGAGRRMASYAIGMMLRLLVVGAAAFWLVPLLGLPAAATLFSLVATLFVSTLLEPVLYHSNFWTFR